ncbi:hypothetical protein TRFO_26441 [Tritrichomonas foetus]|uniref:Uncharacterized protein n=1 Tax=Tritrichomonas foetus TaxID=1144522 RepID=A0A1J4K2U1_9EUKA|nr:hypothetical protein TRFO_26441 [Tritrichomonas foetus]|eukprot:OHT05761.1 hypothetical protein TRFO_26441 [Tritrichomonas foetus]
MEQEQNEQNQPQTTEEEEEQVEEYESEPFQESEEIPENDSQCSQDEVTENPFGFLFSTSVTHCFTNEHKNEGDPFVFFSGNTYQGEMHEGIIHGQGEYTWTDLGAKYSGTFNWGNFTGTGRIQWKDGSTYDGNVVNGIRNGQGTYRRAGPKPFVYEGEWLNGKFHGHGICYYGEQGCDHHYEGNFENGEREGDGTMYYPNGNIYEGQWHLGKRHGHGKFTWKESGSYYVGEFQNGQMSGQGEIVYAFSAQSPSVQFVQSNRYLGSFENSLRNGQGTFYYANGAVYKGEWKDNRKNGIGTFTSRDGRVYHSEFRDGSIYQDGQLFVPTPSISLNFPLDGLLAPSESSDEVMNSLCNIYVRFLPKLRALYQQYSRIQWADDKTITALRMVGMWRFLQDKGTILQPSFRLSDADDVVQWNLENPSVKTDDSNSKDSPLSSGLNSMPSTFGFDRVNDLEPITFENQPLKFSPDPFATLFLYQLFESLVRLAHHQLKASFPDSLILQVTRFLENSIFVDDSPPENPYSLFRKSVSNTQFDDMVTKYSPKLLELYLDFSGYASGCSKFQTRQLKMGIQIDSNVDVTVNVYSGIMTIRDLVLFLGDRYFFEDEEKLSVMDVLCFQKFAGVTRAIEEEEEATFRRFFTSFMKSKVTFVEFVQTLAFVADKLIPFDWEPEMKFEYVVTHLDQWRPPTPPESVANESDVNEEEEEEPEAQSAK